ncbi:MAG: hypothetical protein M3Y25_01190, partial [Thermoproteota archaeon]|nr:hypothetical protein [Thermoproteota archaeon]
LEYSDPSIPTKILENIYFSSCNYRCYKSILVKEIIDNIIKLSQEHFMKVSITVQNRPCGYYKYHYNSLSL